MGPLAVGLMNGLQFGSYCGAQMAAMLISLVQSDRG